MNKKDYKAKLAKQTELAIALIETIGDFREDLTEIEVVGALQLVSWQRGMGMFGKSMLEDKEDD